MKQTILSLAVATATAMSFQQVAPAQGCLGPGGVVDKTKISATAGGFTGLANSFGHYTSSLPDLDGDGVSELAVGNGEDEYDGLQLGAVWILFLDADGAVKRHQKISAAQGGFGGTLEIQDYFGDGVATIGDVDGDGVIDIAAGAYGDDDGGWNQGAVWVLFLNSDGTVKSEQKISAVAGNFAGDLLPGDGFGCGIAGVGDLDGDGVPDLAVGARENNRPNRRGSVWVLFLNPDGRVKGYQRLSSQLPGGNGTEWGSNLAPLPDFDGNGTTDLIVSGPGNDLDGPLYRGSICLVCLNPDGTVSSLQRIGPGLGGFTPLLEANDGFGEGVGAIGDLDGDGVGDLAAGAPGDDDGGPNRGATYLLFLNSDKTVKAEQKISSAEGDFGYGLDDSDEFGTSATSIGDLSGDGFPELAIGAVGDDDGGSGRGAIWILSLNPEPSAHPPTGDFNDDCGVDALDLALLLGAWGSSDPLYDLDGDGTVGGEDLAVLLGAWTG